MIANYVKNEVSVTPVQVIQTRRIERLQATVDSAGALLVCALGSFENAAEYCGISRVTFARLSDTPEKTTCSVYFKFLQVLGVFDQFIEATISYMNSRDYIVSQPDDEKMLEIAENSFLPGGKIYRHGMDLDGPWVSAVCTPEAERQRQEGIKRVMDEARAILKNNEVPIELLRAHLPVAPIPGISTVMRAFRPTDWLIGKNGDHDQTKITINIFLAITEVVPWVIFANEWGQAS